MNSPEPPVSLPGRSRHLDGPEVVTVDQPFDGAGLYSLRATIAAHASRLGAPVAMVDRLIIVASELATNAIRHGGGAGRLRLWRTGPVLFCRVSDEGPGIADAASGQAPPSPTAAGGRGMWICRQLADDLIVDSGSGGATVTAVLTLSTAGAASSGAPDLLDDGHRAGT
jgi:anti-sigma regulatory factor (Ser/Thr protein kinase)